MSSSIPATTRALVVRAKGEIVLDASIPTPKLRDDYLLVKTTAVALNPTDWKSSEMMMGGSTIGTRVGCDYAGIVVAVGSKVTQPFKVGDRIAGGAHGSNQSQPEDGAFGEYIAVKPDLAFKIPDFMSNEDAASLPLGLTTVGQGLIQGLKLNTAENPLKTPENILIYGGATATGQLGIQYAKLAGYRVLTTASAKHTEHLKSLGASEVIDYHDTDAALTSIKAALNGGALRYAWDCVSSDKTTDFCAKALAFTPPSAAEGEGSLHYYSLLYIDIEKAKKIDARIEGGFTFYYTAFGETFEKWQPFPGDPQQLQFARQFWEAARKLIDAGKIKPAKTFANRGGQGFEGVLEGLKELKADKVSGGKLVYTISQ
ncbi:putative secondary metabolism biosynthetic enzyme [Sporothrix curviconia]|uniref:Secondary metabolism biosynthetic enzyme n=1 Tax=Sporothrix curviconia TaxID=1260050 RepID=A0ABP0BCD1_9PEZI